MQVLLSPVTACRFAYLYYDTASRQFSWRPTWPSQPSGFPKTLPRGIQLTLEGPAPLPLSLVHEIPVGQPGAVEGGGPDENEQEGAPSEGSP